MLEISSPWVNYRKKVYNIFSRDEEIHVDDNLTDLGDGNYVFMISSKNGDKLNAIEKLLGSGRSFGNINVHIKYGYENTQEENWAEVWKTAFEGNPLFKELVSFENVPILGAGAYAVFNKEIISFFDDNLADYCGNSHYVVADVIKDVVNLNGVVRPCTSCE